MPVNTRFRLTQLSAGDALPPSPPPPPPPTPLTLTDDTVVAVDTLEANPATLLGTNVAGNRVRRVDPNVFNIHSTAVTVFGVVNAKVPDGAGLGEASETAVLLRQRIKTAEGPDLYAVQLREVDLADIGGGGGSGDVVGPASAFDNAVARYDGTTGKLIQGTGQAILGDDGGFIRYPAAVTPSTALTDAAYAALVPNGTTYYPDVYKSPRPESIPHWNRSVTVSANPSGSIPNVVMSEGWNVAAGSAVQNAALGGAWTAIESYWKPGADYNVLEFHGMEVYQPAGRWWSGSSRRAVGVEAFNVGGFGGYGVPVTSGWDTDVLALRSSVPSQVAYGGQARHIGRDYLVAFNSPTTGYASLQLNNCNMANAHTLALYANADGTSLIQADNRLILVSGTNTIWIGPGATFLGPHTPATSTDADAANGTAYRSSDKAAFAYRSGGVVFKLSHRPAEMSGRLNTGTVYPLQGKATIPVSWTLLTLKGESGSGSFSLKLNGSHVTGSPVAFTATQADTVLTFATAAGDLLEAETDAAVRMTLSGTQQL